MVCACLCILCKWLNPHHCGKKIHLATSRQMIGSRLVGEDDSSPDSPGFSAFKGGILAYWCRFLTLKSYPKHHPYFSNKLIKSYWLERGGNPWQGKAGCGIEVGHGSTITFYRDICRCTSIQFSCPRS